MKHNISDILEKGIELIRLNGYHNTGVRDILKACNMPKGSFYHCFESKEDFIIKAIHHFDEIISEDTAKNFSDQKLSYFGRIKNHFQLHINWYIDHDFRVGCLLGNLSTEIGGTIDSVSTEIGKVYEKWAIGLATFIKEGQKAGEISDQMDAVDLANYLFDSFNGALGRMKVERSRKPLDRFLNVNLQLIKPVNKAAAAA